ncbi:hypothetical protein D3C85_603150 [compost metagenome]
MHLCRLRVPGNVRQRFLHDAEQSGGGFFIQIATEVFVFRRHRAIDRAALPELFKLPLDRCLQSQIEYGWPKIIDDTADTADGCIEVIQRIAGLFVEPGVHGTGARLQHGDIDSQRQQTLSQLVMDVACDPLSLFFLDVLLIGGQFTQLQLRLQQFFGLHRQFALQVEQVDKHLDLGAKNLGHNRREDVIDCAGRITAETLGIGVGLRRDEDNGRVGRLRAAVNECSGFKTVHHWHFHVEQNDGEVALQ